MEKSPAFQWYPKDYSADINVKLMTLEERGAYVELMNVEWTEKSLPIDDNELAVLSQLGEKWFSGSGEKIKKCFKEKKGRLIHPRLEKERKKQKEWRKKCSEAGKKSATVRKDSKKQVKGSSTNLSTVVQPKGNIASSSSSSSSTPVKDKKHIYGEFKKVRLTDKELGKLKEKFPDYLDRIKGMDEGEAMKGYGYKSHYLAILKWARNEKAREAEDDGTQKYRDAGLIK